MLLVVVVAYVQLGLAVVVVKLVEFVTKMVLYKNRFATQVVMVVVAGLALASGLVFVGGVVMEVLGIHPPDHPLESSANGKKFKVSFSDSLTYILTREKHTRPARAPTSLSTFYCLLVCKILSNMPPSHSLMHSPIQSIHPSCLLNIIILFSSCVSFYHHYFLHAFHFHFT